MGRSLAVGTPGKTLAVKWVVLAVAILAGCARSSEPKLASFAQEPVSAVGRLPTSGNLVSFGASVDASHYGAAIARIDSITRGRLPGVRFELYRYPLLLANGQAVHSFRAPTERLIVLSWWLERGRWTFGDVEWEVEHLVARTDDAGNPWNPR